MAIHRNTARQESVLSEAGLKNALLEEILGGLSRREKTLPCKLFYDETGSELFEKICLAEEYYVSRAETAIFEKSAGEICSAFGPDIAVIELGSGSSRKTRLLLDQLRTDAAYVPIDISGEFLHKAAEGIRHDYPFLTVNPVVADFSDSLELPEAALNRRKIFFFPGSTIGNFEPDDADRFISGIGQHCGAGDSFLVGFDLDKEPGTIERAYNDNKNLTSEFNLNALRRLNREFRGNFDLKSFVHRAVYNRALRRVEMYLISRTSQMVSVAARHFFLYAGEKIRTEYSYKFTGQRIDELARSGGFKIAKSWTDEDGCFAEVLFEKSEDQLT